VLEPGLNDPENLLRIQNICQTLPAICTLQFQLVSFTNHFTSPLFELVFKPLPIVADFGVILLIG
jgi:hypothetical protein